MKKRILTLLLALVMVLGMFPVSAIAAERAANGNEIDITDINIRNMLVVGSVTIGGATVVSAEETASNTLHVVLDANTAPGTKLTATFNLVKQALGMMVQGNTCTLNSDGEGTMSAAIAATPNGHQVVGQAQYTIRFSTQKGEALAVSLPSGEGYTVTGRENVYAGSNYSFAVALKESHKAGADFAVKVNGETVGTEPGSYTVENVTEDLTITVEGVTAKEVFTVTLPGGEGYTVTGQENVYAGSNYSFAVALKESHKAGADFAVKVNGETVGTEPGSYTVENVTEDLTITVEGVTAKEVFTVTLPSGEGYTVTGDTTVTEGGTYRFTVTFAPGYVADENCCVKVNGETVGAAAGSYTVENVHEDLEILVEGVVPGAVPTVILTGGRKPDKTWGYVDKITVEQVQVENFVWVGDHAYLCLTPQTAENAVAKVTFTTGGMRMGAMPDTYVELVDGIADKAFTAKTSVFNYTWNFTLHFSNVGFVPTLSDGTSAESAATVYTGDTYSLNLNTVFSDLFGTELTYFVKVDDGEYAPVDGATFTLPCTAEGTKVLTFKANNGKLDSEDTYTVTLNTQNLSYKTVTVMVPEAYAPVFCVTDGFDSNGTDQPGEALETAKGETTDGLTAYAVTVDSLAEYISVRVADWGGVAIAAEADGTVTLRPVSISLTNTFGNEVAGSYTVAYDGKQAVSGSDGRFMLVVGQQYTMTGSPADTAHYKVATNAYTPAAGTEVDTVNALVSLNKPKAIIAPSGAQVQLFSHNKYYDNTEYACIGTADNLNGTSTYYFAGVTVPAGGGTTIYRVTYQDYIVKAGWSDATSTVTVAFSENDLKSDARVDYSESTAASKDLGDDSLVLNVNSRNFLPLSVGGTHTLKAYRTWEIIPVSYNNWIIEPDFHFNVVWESEEGVVNLTEVMSPMTGGESWRKITGCKEGVAVIEVAYDAIDIRGTYAWTGVYGASDPARTGLVVVQVGGSKDTSVNFGIHCFASIGTKGSGNVAYNPNKQCAWDAEFDTLYFLGEYGELQLTPSCNGTIAEVAVSNDKGASWTVLNGVDGTYTAKIASGNNIIRVTTDNGTSYQVVRGDKVTHTVTEVAEKSDKDGILEAGETVRITISGMHAAIPKMAGNYNPGYGGNNDGYSLVHMNYTLGDTAVYGPGAQYTFQNTHNYIEITIPEDATESVTLTDGYIGLGVVGLTNFTDGGDSHRNIPDAGCATRGNQSTWHTRSMLPEITIALESETAPNNAPAVKADAPTEASLVLRENIYTYALNLALDVFADADAGDVLTYTVSVNGGEETPVENGYYSLVHPEVGIYTLVFKAHDGKDGAAHTVTLTVTKETTPAPNPKPDEDEEDGIKGYVTVSFEDKAIRVPGETGLLYPNPLGMIVSATRVPYYEGDTIADVTLRLLDSKGMTYQHTGSTKANFYLGAIGNFDVGGVHYEEMAEFDAGQGSGWMITWEGEFINRGASAFKVKNNDYVRWQYTCQYGKDIGDPYWETADPTPEKTEKPEQEKVTFTDIDAKSYYSEAVSWALNMGITQGVAKETFAPDANCTRAQMVTFLWRAAGSPEPANTACTFADADPNSYWYKALLWAVENGITSGTGANTFSPDSICTRGQMAAFLYRSAKSPAVKGYHEFADVQQDAYYNDAVLWAAKKKITTGTAKDAFSPDAACTRGQMVTFLYRYFES